MITMNELVDLRMQQHIAHEIYRQQIMQRIPDPFPPMLPIPMPRHVIMPPRVTLPGVEMTLQNDDLWKQFHQIGTEMIITKSGRRMFPSMRLSVSGLEDESNYCVLLEMVPIGDCRYKFSGSQWVPAGGAEPQSPQRMYLHPDSPATGAHWQAQPILFNKVKLTNNTLDNSGHIVLASMHKYQPRLHVIRTADLAQIPWAPQQAFVFAETEFVAVTAYQNDRITKLKIDNNPFAKGFRETGQSRCKRKMSSSPTGEDQDQSQSQSQSLHHSQSQSESDMSPAKGSETAGGGGGGASTIGDSDGPQIKRLRSNGSACSLSSSLDDPSAPGASSLALGSPPPHPHPHPLQARSASSVFMQHFQQNMQSLLRPSLVDLACTYFGRPHEYGGAVQPTPLYSPAAILHPGLNLAPGISGADLISDESGAEELELDVGSETTTVEQSSQEQPPEQPSSRSKGFSISAILGGGS
ncbi:T-box transcription factor TBX3 [Drosophila subpulchrella]|uniref:T-box transcription factor TBX3 n=1 Tax=Drosophila subpulchrella TaxID=1486046 RepID=UPI0018A130C5|nr:T-box transcription factor TBX3 [Drosophila subpulchrella]XP_037720019.1 T-box transcription factor TBX3 [Drosophila subpulchrella]